MKFVLSPELSTMVDQIELLLASDDVEETMPYNQILILYHNLCILIIILCKTAAVSGNSVLD